MASQTGEPICEVIKLGIHTVLLSAALQCQTRKNLVEPNHEHHRRHPTKSRIQYLYCAFVHMGTRVDHLQAQSCYEG